MRYTCLMLTAALILSIAGLALLDSLNPITFAGVALILVAPIRRPLASGVAFVSGVFFIVLAVGVSLFLGLDALGDAVNDAAVWVRRIALLLAGLVLMTSGIKRLRRRRREAVELPAWFSPWTAAPLGFIATAADLPNAFPYLLAIERLTAADVGAGTGMVVLIGYAFIYCLPSILLLTAGTIWRERISARLSSLYERFGSAREMPSSLPAAAALTVLGLMLAGIGLSLGN
jgi:cytochrome c biogenesis protein CcdA